MRRWGLRGPHGTCCASPPASICRIACSWLRAPLNDCWIFNLHRVGRGKEDERLSWRPLKSARRGQDGKIARHRTARGPWTQIPEVALLLETSTEYGRGLLRGILKYVRLHGPWSLSVAPGHLDQSLPSMASWKGTGVIARVRTPEMVKWVRSTRLPLVVSSLLESQPFSPNRQVWRDSHRFRGHRSYGSEAPS